MKSTYQKICLKIAIACGMVMMLAWPWLLMGCANVDTWQVKPNCVPRALYSAYVAHDAGYQVRIRDGLANGHTNVYHWQAEVLLDGEWWPITNDWVPVKICKPDSWYSPNKTWTLYEAWNHQLQFIK